ncbi:MAG TPA: STAS domain-containing protein [Vicinamibacterales bacterium]|nr:STAS domain-containing protein [Vicinamibacterales bacterium]
MSLKISERDVRGVTILDLEGRLVMEDGVPDFVERVSALIRQSRRRILLNFDQVTYLDSAGVGAIAWKYATAQRRGIDIKLLNLRRKSHNVLNTTRLLTVLKTFESENEAIDSFVDEDDDDVNPIFT